MKKGLIPILILSLIACSNEQSEESIYALLVAEGNKTLSEAYTNGKTKDDLVNVQSVTKSIVSLLIGIAIEKNFIAGDEVLVQEYFPEKFALQNEASRSIAIKHLLNHTSGWEWNGYEEHEAFLASSNASNYVLEKPMVDHPGEKYTYNSGATHLLSGILTQSTGMSTLSFANQHLFEPLGITRVNWKNLSDGFSDGAGFGLEMRPADLLKIGQLLLNNGAYEGIQIVPENWIDKIFNEDLKKETKWGLRGSKHGYGWYSKTGKVDILYAMGYGGQFILMLPEKDLVIVATHNHDTLNGIDQQVDFIAGTLPGVLDMYSK